MASRVIDYTDPLALIKREEGFLPRAKWDYKQYSGGYGSRASAGEVFTPEKAESYLRRDAAPVLSWLDKHAPSITPQQKAALTSFGYNLGVDDLERLRPDIQAGDWNRVATRLRSFNKAGGEVLPGLVARRAREAALLTGGDPSAAALAQVANVKDRIGTSTEGGATSVPALSGSDAGDRLKKALYDQSLIDSGKSMQEQGMKIATGGTKLGAFGGALVAALGGALEGYEGSKKKEADAAFSEAVSKAGDGTALMNALLGSSDPKMREAGIELKAKMMTPKATEWTPVADGTAVINKATGEVRQTGIQKPVAPVEVGGRLVSPQPDGSYKEVYAAPAKPEALREVAPGATVFDPNKGAAVFTAPSATPPKTEKEKLADAAGLPDGSQARRDFLMGKKEATEKWNEGQGKAANFGNMMVKAEELISNMGPKDEMGKPKLGPDGKPMLAESPKTWLGAVRDGLVPFEGLRNLMTPDQQQTYNQAAAQWIRAKLRKESGAAIGVDEMEKEFRTYFPQYGDGPEVIKQKADARAEAMQGMISESAGAYEHFFKPEAKKTSSGSTGGFKVLRVR